MGPRFPEFKVQWMTLGSSIMAEGEEEEEEEARNSQDLATLLR